MRAPPRFFVAPHRSRSKNLVGSVLVKQSDLCTRLRKIGTERNVAAVLLLSNGFFGLPKNCNDGALIDRCDVSHAPKTKTTLNVVQPKCALSDHCDAGEGPVVETGFVVQPKCALPDHCDGASIKYVGHRPLCLCSRAPLQLAGLPKRV